MLELKKDGALILNGKKTNFIIQEFLPKGIFKRKGINPLWYIDEGLVRLAQFYHDWWNTSITINNYHWGGNRNLSGFRLPQTGFIKHLKENGLNEDQIKDIKNALIGIQNMDSETLSISSWWSMHKLKIAMDPLIKGVSADKARQEILDNKNSFMDAGLTTLESGKFAPTWVHSDLRPTGLTDILIVGDS